MREMLERHNRNHNEIKPIMVDEETDFNLYEGFLAFAKAFQEDDPSAWLSESEHYKPAFDRVVQVFYFAKMYGIDSLMDSCKRAAKYLVNVYVKDPELAGIELPACLNMVHTLYVEDLVSLDRAMDKIKTVTVELSPSLLLEKFELAKKWNVDEFLDQVVTFATFMDPDTPRQWPRELLTRVLKEHRVESEKARMKKLHEDHIEQIKKIKRN